MTNSLGTVRQWRRSSSLNQSMSMAGSDVFSGSKSGTPVPRVTLAVEKPLYDKITTLGLRQDYDTRTDAGISADMSR